MKRENGNHQEFIWYVVGEKKFIDYFLLVWYLQENICFLLQLISRNLLRT